MRRTTRLSAGRLVLLTVLVAAVPAARSCGYHDPASVSLGMLNWAYPDALHVKTAVWMAQRDGVLKSAQSPSGADPQYPALLRQMAQLRQTTAELAAIHKRIVSAPDGRAMPSFSVVLIGPMLWTRFHVVDGVLAMAVHADGPAVEDVILVTDAPVIEALAAGQLAPAEARRHGLLRSYGKLQDVERIEIEFDRMAPLQAAGVLAEKYPR